MGTSDPKPLPHGGISEAAAVALYGPDVLAPASEPPAEPAAGDEDAVKPWDDFKTHADFDGFIDSPDNGLSRPFGWSAKTIAQKKEWLDLNG